MLSSTAFAWERLLPDVSKTLRSFSTPQCLVPNSLREIRSMFAVIWFHTFKYTFLSFHVHKIS